MDRREAIILRLVEICGTLGAALVDRNRLATSDLRTPALLVHDGAEEADDSDPRLRPSNAPRRITMRPSIVVAVARGTSLGPTLNGFRAAIIKAVVSDDTLQTLTLLGNGAIRYAGGGFDLLGDNDGQAMLSADFAITYLLNPTEL